ncbi:hypothetical protein GN244_ATG04808 [Phytophthora infestans]|uniref:Uncharacterized protein n=1 Tax=Phytophthora infestans TaxID=4787 RepID=A0A833W5D0_PHYIN|nr:hypothetical protein GN244_ATG04808 [Phytophthora infestans]KAF4138450.1 hypothetical protein GN958_ATG12316 [Phytophthora infestans]KAI9994429.1 hypothetical protein PInf_011057 [Phytophthora infestans]KAI9994461.1 hypothetical protein PInf_011093 [Phytophthora infestans]
MADKKRTSGNFLEEKTQDNDCPKRVRTDTPPVKTPAASLPDAETELLRALEEEILKEEEKNKHDKNKKFPPEEEDDDYDESDEE